MANKWTDQEIVILKDYEFFGTNIPELRKRHSKQGISTMARKKGIRYSVKWTDREIIILKRDYKKFGSNIPELLKRHSRMAIYLKAFEMGFKREGNWRIPPPLKKDVGYAGLHRWIRKHKPKPEFCEICNEKPPYDVANLSGEYKRDINDFMWICRKCHMKDDGRFETLKYIKKGKKKKKRKYRRKK